MNKVTKRHFWDWFARNHHEYLALNSKSKKEYAYWVRELSAHLRAYFKFFSFSIEFKTAQTAILTITVHGKAKHFKKVDAMVDIAPELPGWIFMALEMPRPIDFFLEKHIMRTGIDPRELYFSFDIDGPHNTTLYVYHPLCTKKNKNLIYGLAYYAAYNLLGERSFGMSIECLEVFNLSVAGDDDIKQLEELPAHIGQCKSAVVIDSEGNLISDE